MYLEHANITVESIEKSTEFLQAAFPDFVLRGEGNLMNQNGRWAHVGNDRFYFALQQCDNHLSDVSTRYINDGINHIGMVVEDLDGVTGRLQQRGYDGYETESNPFRRRAYYFDPNGIEWEFVQYLSESPAEKNRY
ncbi:VOC family protein [Hahella aquimaris]|uniref:VOC family protein n=1 Tax=Hahella sp. HNIBRBA332 TaxID=3015983 RepID=UPI00273B0371|nr:VOC family protein [Hahella sp. HNIBRBA332]WLQ11702.1 VOC family protein [Hahella sp. HNIBRBA332]